MAALFFILVVNLVFCSADEASNSSNISDFTKSRKIKHSISRIYSVPQKTKAGNIDGESYKKIIDILSNNANQEASASEINTNDVNTEKLIYLFKDRNLPISKNVYSQILNGNEIAKNAISESSTKLNSFYVNGENIDNVENVASTQQTELNADMINEIIQNLKVSNLSKQNKIRKGKLVIYYDENEESSDEPTEGVENIYTTEFNDLQTAEEDILNLYTQYSIPLRIYYAIQKADIDIQERRSKLIAAFIKYLVLKERMDLDILDIVKELISKYAIDLDPLNLFIQLKNKFKTDDIETGTRLINTAKYVIESVLDNDNVVTEQEGKLVDETSTILNIPVIHQLGNKLNTDTVNNLSDITSTVRNLLLNQKNSVYPLPDKDILPNDEINLSKDRIKEPAIAETIVPIPSDIRVYSNPVIEAPSKPIDNILNIIASQAPPIDNKPKNENKYDALIQLFKNIQISNKNEESNKQNDLIKQLLEQLNQNYVTSAASDNCEESGSCSLEEGDSKFYSFDLEMLKSLTNDALKNFIPQLEEGKTNVPVFSNIPVDDYLKNNKGKPFLIFVVFPEASGSRALPGFINPSQIYNEKDKPQDISKDDEDDIVKNVLPIFPKSDSPKNNFPNLIKDIPQKPNKNEAKGDNIPVNILDIINDPKIDTQNHPVVPHALNSDNPVYDIIVNLNKNIFSKDNPENKAVIDSLRMLSNDNLSEQIPNIEALMQLNPDIHKSLSRTLFGTSEGLKILMDNPSLLKVLLYLEDVSNADDSSKQKKGNTELRLDEDSIEVLTDKLIKRLIDMQKILENQNVPRHIIRNILDKETQNAIFKIRTHKIHSCVEKVNSAIQSGVYKAQMKYIRT